MSEEYVLEMRDIVKRFPGVVAVKNGQLTLKPGEVHCLVGENGAGKSTLMKILSGAQPMDTGAILLSGKPITIHSPHHAQQLGISMIYQEFNLSPYLSVAENIYLGREPRLGKSPFINWSKMYNDARAIMKRIRVNLDVRKPVNECSVAQQQMVEIAKAISFNSRIIVMDEPSATLTDHELDALFLAHGGVPFGIPPVGIATIHDGIAGLQQAEQFLDHLVGHVAGRHHHPNGPWWR